MLVALCIIVPGLPENWPSNHWHHTSQDNFLRLTDSFNAFESLWDLSGFGNYGSLSHAEHENPANFLNCTSAAGNGQLLGHFFCAKRLWQVQVSVAIFVNKFHQNLSSLPVNWVNLEEYGRNVAWMMRRIDWKTMKNPFQSFYLFIIYDVCICQMKMAQPRLPRHCRLRCQMARRSWAE